MKVVFFDVDGVLNSEKFICSNKQGEFINPKNVSNLRSIVEATGAKLVLTCDWRKSVMDKDLSKAQVRELTEKLADAGMEVYGITSSGAELQDKYGDYTRACAVKDYITTNSVEAFAILDDMDLDWERLGLYGNWVNTENIISGLTAENARSAIAMINGESNHDI